MISVDSTIEFKVIASLQQNQSNSSILVSCPFLQVMIGGTLQITDYSNLGQCHPYSQNICKITKSFLVCSF